MVMTPQRHPDRATLADGTGAPCAWSLCSRSVARVVRRHKGCAAEPTERAVQVLRRRGWPVVWRRETTGVECVHGFTLCGYFYRYALDASVTSRWLPGPAGSAAAPGWRRSPAHPCVGVAREQRRVIARCRCCRCRDPVPSRCCPPAWWSSGHQRRSPWCAPCRGCGRYRRSAPRLPAAGRPRSVPGRA